MQSVTDGFIRVTTNAGTLNVIRQRESPATRPTRPTQAATPKPPTRFDGIRSDRLRSLATQTWHDLPDAVKADLDARGVTFGDAGVRHDAYASAGQNDVDLHPGLAAEPDYVIKHVVLHELGHVLARHVGQRRPDGLDQRTFDRRREEEASLLAALLEHQPWRFMAL